MSNVKNYTEPGGEKTVIGGILEIISGGKLTFNDIEFSPNIIKGDTGEKGDKGDTGDSGTVTPASYQADSTATTVAGLKDDFNALLSKLKVAGLMATE